MTKSENQFKEGQEVWVKARIRSGIVFSDNTIAIRIRSANQDHFLYYCLCSEIRTTEQIWKDVITNDSKSDKFRVYIDDVRQGLNYYYIYSPDGTEAVLPKDCYSPREVIEICDAENAKIATQCAAPTTISNTETVTEAPEEKFFIEDETSYDSYTINFGTPDDYQFVAKLDTDFYTLEEAWQECEKLSKK